MGMKPISPEVNDDGLTVDPKRFEARVVSGREELAGSMIEVSLRLYRADLRIHSREEAMARLAQKIRRECNNAFSVNGADTPAERLERRIHTIISALMEFNVPLPERLAIIEHVTGELVEETRDLLAKPAEPSV